MSHTNKLLERMIEHRLRHEATILENQFGFMLGRSTMEAIFFFSLKCIMERYREVCEDIHMVFIDLEKAMIGSLERLCGGF
jgi:hypothetical protein